MRDLADNIARIGEQMAGCTAACAGVNCDQRAGIVPRCLILETEGRSSGSRGCVVIGINPGTANPPEIEYYRRNGPSYRSIVRYWHTNLRSHQYYVRLRTFLEQVGLVGPILWTELAKCENPPKVKGLPPLKTLRTCTGKFLSRELELVPEWPLIAIGGEAFRALAYLYPKRTLIGVPHPTGSFGNFPRLMPGGRIKEEAATLVIKTLKGPAGNLVSLAEYGRRGA